MPAHVPFAEYELTAMPEGTRASMRVGERLVLNPAERVEMGVVTDVAITVERHARLHFGGRRNHGLKPRGDHWEFTHYGHSLPIHVNGRALWAQHALQHGDRVVPSVTLTDFRLPSPEAESLVFTFFQRDDLEPLFVELISTLPALLDEGPVLFDWFMERGLSLEDAQRAKTHFMFRRAYAAE